MKVLTCYCLMCNEHMLWWEWMKFLFFPDGWVVIQPASLTHIQLAKVTSSVEPLPPLCTSDTLTVVKENGLEMRKLWPTKTKKEGWELAPKQKKPKNKPNNTITKSCFLNTPKNSLFVCCSVVVIRVPSWFVELRVVFL
jgi:hypothetical protein